MPPRFVSSSHSINSIILSNILQQHTTTQATITSFLKPSYKMVTATTHPVRASGASAKLFPLAVVAGTVTIVVGYVSSQLHNSRNVMDSRFAQYNNPQSEANRAKTFEGTNLDPRKSMFNILGH